MLGAVSTPSHYITVNESVASFLWCWVWRSEGKRDCDAVNTSFDRDLIERVSERKQGHALEVRRRRELKDL